MTLQAETRVNAGQTHQTERSGLCLFEENRDGQAPAWLQLGIRYAVTTIRKKPRRDPVRPGSAALCFYQAIQYFSLDIAEFVDKGPRINEVQSA
jgi:hypothetical protein